MRFIERRIRRRPRIEPWQRLDLVPLGLSRADCERAVQWVGSDGGRVEGHEAIARVLIHGGGPWSLLGRAIVLPGVAWVSRRVYSWVARNRHRLPGGTAECALPADDGQN